MADKPKGSDSGPELSKAAKQAAMFLKSKRENLAAVGAPIDGTPVGTRFPSDKRTMWATYFHIQRKYGLDARKVDGMNLWSLYGRRQGVVQTANGMVNGAVTFGNITPFTPDELTEQDFAEADAFIQAGVA